MTKDAQATTVHRPTLWVVSELYYPEQTSTGYFLTGIAEGLADQFDVRAVCGQPTYSSAGVLAPRTEIRSGVEIHRMRGTRFAKDRLVLRLFNILTLSVSTFLFLLRRVRAGDRLLVVTNPPAAPSLVAVVAKLRRARSILLVHDVYPEVLVAVGMASAKTPVVRLLQWVMRWTFAAYDRVVVLGDDMAQLVHDQRGVTPAQLSIIPNWGDVDGVVPSDFGENDIGSGLRLKNKTVIQYSGNIGRTHDIELVLEVAWQLGHRDDIVFLFAGEGGKMPVVEAAARSTRNIAVLPRQPAAQLSALLSCATATIIALPLEMTGISVPSRMYNVMAAGRPIISVGDASSTLSKTVVSARAGWFSPPDVSALRGLIEHIATPEGHVAAAEMGRNARRLTEGQYTRDAVIGQYRALIETLA